MQYYQRFTPEIVSWKIDSDYAAAQAKKAAYAAVNDKYTTEIASIREAIRCMQDAGKSAATVQAKLTAKQAEYKAALLGMI